MAWVGNIESITKKNKQFRKIVHTIPKFQLVVMTLEPKEDIGMEAHHGAVQFVRVEEGTGKAIVGGVTHRIKAGSALIIPPDTQHNIINTSRTKKMQIYVIYTPPQH
ncbi:cupin domain-containing protein [Candidatus Saccharibacteria bacterium]|nr:cupin domain-containing protein [Candidatus Saccharibacteria bacterium]